MLTHLGASVHVMTVDDLPWQVIGPGSGWVIIVGLIVAFFRGKVWTDAAYQQKVHEANEWRTESRIKDQQILEKDIQLRELSEVGTTVEQIMRSIERNARSGDQRSRDDS